MMEVCVEWIAIAGLVIGIAGLVIGIIALRLVYRGKVFKLLQVQGAENKSRADQWITCTAHSTKGSRPIPSSIHRK